ncbi:MAG: SDR family oxidoreductase [Gammaproteobacteria bacterium]|nr:SDR family oxidoreductase [Gammaproteobacteria bacterium]
MGKLSGRVALVTGSGRGIGRAIALAYAKEGAKVAITSRTRNELDGVAAEIAALGGESFVVTADLLNGPEIKAMVETVIAHFGQLDILYNNGGGLTGDLGKMLALTHDDELFDRNVFLNLNSAYYATRAALPQMVKQNYGRVIFQGSGYAKVGGGLMSYSAAKHGLIGMMRAMAYQVPTTITINTICPGWTNTPLADWEYFGKCFGADAATLKAQAESENVQKRILEPEELGPMAVLVASEEAKGITGQVISVDGGYRV